MSDPDGPVRSEMKRESNKREILIEGANIEV